MDTQEVKRRRCQMDTQNKEKRCQMDTQEIKREEGV